MQKIKQFIESEKGKDILIVIIVILVGMCSFELGRLSKTSSNSSGIKIYPSQNEEMNETPIQTTDQGANVNEAISSTKTVLDLASTSGKNYFASKRGKKYYTLGCSAGKSLKQENRIYFSTSEQAEKAGYTLSSSCN